MFTLTLTLYLWLGALLTTCFLHIAASLLTDNRVVFGTWGKVALTLLILLGPVGTALEIMLVISIAREGYWENHLVRPLASGNQSAVHEYS